MPDPVSGVPVDVEDIIRHVLVDMGVTGVDVIARRIRRTLEGRVPSGVRVEDAGQSQWHRATVFGGVVVTEYGTHVTAAGVIAALLSENVRLRAALASAVPEGEATE